MNINKDTLTLFRVDFEEAVKKLEQKYKLKIKLGSISYDNFHFTGKIDCKTEDKEAINEHNKQLNEFLKTLYGAKFEIGFEFNAQGRHFKVIELSTKSKSLPIVIQDDEGKSYKCKVDYVNQFVKSADKQQKPIR